MRTVISMSNRKYFKRFNRLESYANTHGIATIVNGYGELHSSYIHHNGTGRIYFSNGWYASIARNMSRPDKNARYSIAVSDYDGFFDWNVLDEYGADDGHFYCNTEEEIIKACEVIRKLDYSWAY